MKDKIEDVINRKPGLLLIHSTVGKQAKRMPDATVETTSPTSTHPTQQPDFLLQVFKFGNHKISTLKKKRSIEGPSIEFILVLECLYLHSSTRLIYLLRKLISAK